MNFLIVFALALSTASAFSVQNSKLGISKGKNAQVAYQVGLSLEPKSRKVDWCGGSLISNQWVLTVAHCTEAVTSVTVYLGGTVRANAEIQHTVKPSDITTHPGWNSDADGVDNDISLIKIPFTAYTVKIQPVKLPAISGSYPSYAGDKAVTSGWGYLTDTTTTYATNLQKALLEVITNDVCAKTYGSYVTASVICVSGAGGVSPCYGDAGGPLVLEPSNVQIGLTVLSNDSGCTKGFPAVYTRITKYLDWIKEKTGVSY